MTTNPLGLPGKYQAISINSNQIWKSGTAGDATLYLQCNTPNGNVMIAEAAARRRFLSMAMPRWGRTPERHAIPLIQASCSRGSHIWDGCNGNLHLSPGGGAGNYIVVPGGVAATGNGWAGIFTANVTGAGGVLSYGGSNNWAGLFYGNTSGNGQYGIAAQGTSWAGYFMGPVRREVLSESRMREICMSGSMSGKAHIGKYNLSCGSPNNFLSSLAVVLCSVGGARDSMPPAANCRPPRLP
jgi:hypothetical protein